MSEIKIVATIGPKTDNVKMLKAMYKSGMNIVRLNSSHGNTHWHRETISLIRSTLPNVPILLDLPGRKVRVGRIKQKFSFNEGDNIIFSPDIEKTLNDKKKVPVTYYNLSKYVNIGNKILGDDGTLEFEIIKIEGQDIHCISKNAGKLSTGMGLNLPGSRLSSTKLLKSDEKLIKFALNQKIDFIGLSFVDNSSYLKEVRNITDKFFLKIISKIETKEALLNLDAIISASDGIMIDRGDLSAETSLEPITLIQKRIIERAKRLSVPVIVATQMLHSMIENSNPTRAEISDITNAVLDGASGLMLSGETAIGSYPEEAVKVMKTVSKLALEHLQKKSSDQHGKGLTIPDAMSGAIGLICEQLTIDKIIAITISGYAARRVAAKFPRQPILAVTNNKNYVRSFNLYPGTRGILVDTPFTRESTDHIPVCLEELWRKNHIKNNDLIVITMVSYPKSGNRMNSLEIHKVSDLVKSLKWNK